MRVLHLISVLAPSGAEQSLVALARPLGELGVEVEVAYLHERPGAAEFLARAGLDAVSLGHLGNPAARLAGIGRLIRECRPDLIHTSLTEANLLGRLAGKALRVPVVASLVNITYGPDELAAPDRTWLGVRSRHVADASTARLVTRFHAVTREVADVMARRLLVPRSRIEVVPRGRDPASLGTRTAERRERVRASLGVLPGDELILAAARQEYQKGLDVLLEALPAVVAARPRARLLVAGRPGAQTATLEEISSRLQLGDRACFLGLRSDVADLLCAADLFALPSRWEGMGGVLLEAMALEAPIVASDLPTLRDSVPDADHARFFPVGDSAAASRVIVEALADPAGSRRRAARSRDRFANHFTVEPVAAAMAALYRRAAPHADRIGRQTRS